MTAAYFAYGSNLDHDRLVGRVGPVDRSTARPARLPGHRLAFTKRSRTAGGAATLEVDGAGVVEGVLWLLGAAQLAALDVVEGVPVHYLRTRVVLEVGGAQAPAWTYLAHPDQVRPGLRPTASYLDHLLRGEPWLSPRYLARLRAEPTSG